MRQGRDPIGLDPRHGVAGLDLPQQMFFVLSDTPCPYLPGRREKKLITEIDHRDPTRTYSALSRAGFRRSHHFAYRPACTACRACVPVRIPVDRFAPSRSQRRVLRANADLNARELSHVATVEQYNLFARYITSRHGNGEMAGMTLADYRSMVHHSRIDSRLTEFRDPEGRLVAVCLIDWLDDGPSAVYSFFDPDLSARSLGTYMILWLIEEARRRGLENVYLGYWIAESPKMSYKLKFRPMEALGAEGWKTLD
jgi:arginyl-tRNA--protein-N-Asp/Glu arginylyltransferase